MAIFSRRIWIRQFLTGSFSSIYSATENQEISGKGYLVGGCPSYKVAITKKLYKMYYSGCTKFCGLHTCTMMLLLLFLEYYLCPMTKKQLSV